MVVHPVGARQQLDKVVITNVQGNGHSNGRPKAVPENPTKVEFQITNIQSNKTVPRKLFGLRKQQPATNPVPELKHVSFVNAELGHQLFVGAAHRRLYKSFGWHEGKPFRVQTSILPFSPEGNKVFGNIAWILGR